MSEETPTPSFDVHYDDLPDVVPVFPLRRVILLPDIPLPLNVFEPRYLNMVLDAMAKGRMIGVVQPTRLEEDANGAPTLAAVGCLGRIVNFTETEDGRLLITLNGVCRFRMVEEIEGTKGYRRLRVDYTDFAHDMISLPQLKLDTASLQAEFDRYLKKKECAIDWEAIIPVPGGLIVDYLSSHLPFSPEEKQALLECMNHADRLALLRGLVRMESSTDVATEEASSLRH